MPLSILNFAMLQQNDRKWRRYIKRRVKSYPSAPRKSRYNAPGEAVIPAERDLVWVYFLNREVSTSVCFCSSKPPKL